MANKHQKPKILNNTFSHIRARYIYLNPIIWGRKD